MSLWAKSAALSFGMMLASRTSALAEESRIGVGGKLSLTGGPIPMVAVHVDTPGRWSANASAGGIYSGLGALVRSEVNGRVDFMGRGDWQPFVQLGAAHTWLSESNISDASLHIIDVHASLGTCNQLTESWRLAADVGLYWAPDLINPERGEEEEDLAPIVPFIGFEAIYVF